MPSGTQISGSVAGDEVPRVGFRNVATGDEATCGSDLDEGQYRWALAPGKYEVIAYDTMGGTATVKEITVASSPIVVDIPANLKFTEPAQVPGTEPKAAPAVQKATKQ